MLSILPIASLFRWLAAIYAATIIVIFSIISSIFDKNTDSISAAMFAVSSSSFLYMALLAWIYFGWRSFWVWMPKLNSWVYPNIDGVWEMEITPRKTGTPIKGEATIVQDFISTSMDVTAPDSNSNTLSSIQIKDRGSKTAEFHYMFLVTTKPRTDKPSTTYKGSAILKLNDIKNGVISGNYWTTSENSGHYLLSNRRERQ